MQRLDPSAAYTTHTTYPFAHSARHRMGDCVFATLSAFDGFTIWFVRH